MSGRIWVSGHEVLFQGYGVDTEVSLVKFLRYHFGEEPQDVDIYFGDQV